MPITTMRCHVLGAPVGRITDLEGHVTRVICAQYDEPSGTCRLRREAQRGGPLSQLLGRVAEETLAQRGTYCALR
jgi:hypothetical protein